MHTPMMMFKKEKEKDFFISYLSSMTKIIFDSILYHNNLKEIYLRSMKIGPIGLQNLFEVLMDNRIYPRISVLDLSNNFVKDFIKLSS